MAGMKDDASRLALRYGTGGAPAAMPPNAVINLMLDHRSVRGYAPDPLPAGALELIVAAAQSAATSSNLQTWSVVAVTDPAKKATLAGFAGGQKHIEECPVFLLFIADLARLNRVGEAAGIPAQGNETFEMFLVAAIDASLAAQNAVLAAESLGLSTVYIGAMRNRPEETAALIGLPRRARSSSGSASAARRKARRARSSRACRRRRCSIGSATTSQHRTRRSPATTARWRISTPARRWT